MILKGIIDEDFVNYKKPCMTLMFPYCTFKCGTELCQNSGLIKEPDIEISVEDVCDRFLHNDIVEALCLQGLEPIDSWADVIHIIVRLRYRLGCEKDIVIYTGYTEEEMQKGGYLPILQKYNNIIIKFGRYIPGQEPHYDEALGVKLASDNQYGMRYEIVYGYMVEHFVQN